MSNLRKIFLDMRTFLLALVLLIITVAPTYASLQKGESLMVAGKIDDAITMLTPVANQNNPRALYLLAIIYLAPNSPHLNVQKGVDLLQRAVFLNYGPAIDELAGLYLSGEGVEKNEAKALHYYIQGAHIGYGPSQFNCGIMYRDGQGTEKNPAKAYLYLSLASLNYKDLEAVTLDAAKYRDELISLLSSATRQDVLRQVNALTLPTTPIGHKGVTP